MYTQISVQRSELTEIRNELTFCSESAPMATVTNKDVKEVEKKTEVKIEVQESNQSFPFTNSEQNIMKETKGKKTERKSDKKNNEQTISMQPNIGTNKEYQDLRKPG